MGEINRVFNEIKDQLGVTPSFVVTMNDHGADILIIWTDEGGNNFEMGTCICKEHLVQKSLSEVFSPLYEDIRDLLHSVSEERSDEFFLDLMMGMIPPEHSVYDKCS